MPFYDTATAKRYAPPGEKATPEPASTPVQKRTAELLTWNRWKEAGVVLNAPAKQVRARRDSAKPLRWFMVTDVVALLLGFVFAWGLAAVVNKVFLDRNVISDGTLRLAQFLIIATGVVLWFEHKSHYRVRRPFWMEAKNIAGTLSFAMIVDGFLQFTAKQDFSRLWLISGWVVAAFGIVALRGLMRSLLQRHGTWEVPTLLVGGGATAEDARAALKSEPGLGYKITAQVQDLSRAFEKAGQSWEELCAAHGADYIVIALDGEDLAHAGGAMAQLIRENVPFSVSPPLRNLPVLGMAPHYFFNHDVMMLTRSSGLEQPLPRALKRSFDVLASSAVLLLSSPVWLVVAVLVKIGGSPVLFGHMRLGRNGKPFRCLKFRSMCMKADTVLQRHLAENPIARAEWRWNQKLRNDPRVTRLGVFLRRYSLDELPQLINVIRGDMSLVGPRPIVMDETGKYECDIAHYYRVRPGITGLWQVCGRNDVSYARRVQMDSWYVRNWSLWHDIAILCKTIPVLWKRTGAY
jgi:undecaprenyl-phosphate galactose phosphotransferase